MAITPTQLDMAGVVCASGVTCDVGYAEFVIPSDQSVSIKSSKGIVILGESASLSFAFLPPHDPSANDEMSSFRLSLAKLPAGHPLRKQLASPGTTTLDMIIYVERMTPEPLWRVLVQDKHLFVFNSLQLLIKGGMEAGSHAVHTFETPEIRGLIYVGRKGGDTSYAHASIENRSGTQSVGMIARIPNGKTGDIMAILSPLLKTFRFKVDHLESEVGIKEIIIQAGVKPRAEDLEAGSSSNPATGKGKPHL